MDEAAQVIASILDKETIITLLQNRLRENEGAGHRTDYEKDDF